MEREVKMTFPRKDVSPFFHSNLFIPKGRLSDPFLTAATCEFDCREYLTLYVRKNWANLTRPPFVFGDRKPRVVLSPGELDAKYATKPLKDRFFNDCEGILKLLNATERRHSWPLTKAYKAVTDDPKNRPGRFGVMFVGSRRWILSSYLFSLWTLYLKLSFVRIPKLPAMSSLGWCRSLPEMRKRLLTDIFTRAADMGNPSGLGQQAKQVVPYTDFLMKNYKELFKVHDLYWYWSTNMLNTNSTYIRMEGIMRLIQGDSVHHEMQALFSKVLKERGMF